MNPEDASTEKLSDVLLDRFDIIYMTYPQKEETEINVLTEQGKKLVDVPISLTKLMVKFVRILRDSDDLEKKPSVRATLGLYERSQANAMIEKKKQVELGHVKDAIISVLSHRIRLKPSVKYLENPIDFVKKLFAQYEEQLIEESGDSP